MGRLAILMVAVMVVLAGCSTGGGGGDGTPETTETTDMSGDMTQTPDSSDDGTDDGSDSDSDDTMDDGSDSDSDDGSDSDSDDTTDDDSDSDSDDTTDDDTQVNVSESLEDLNLSSSGSGSLFDNATSIDVTLYNGSETTTLTIRNDTSANRSLTTLANSQQSGETTIYSTADYVALRNTTSGETRYGERGSGVGIGVAFATLGVFFASAAYIGFVEWDSAEETTVNGQSAVVFEGNSLNESAFDPNDNREEAFGPDQVESVDGRMVVGTDGRFYSVNVEITVDGETFGTDMSLGYDPVTVDQPDWVDESQAPS